MTTTTPLRPVWQRRLGLAATVATIALALPALAAFAGRIWWVFELMSHFRGQYFGCFLLSTLLLLAARCYRRAGLAAGLLVVHAAILWPLYVGDGSGPAPPDAKRLRLVISNVHAVNEEHEKVLGLVRRESPDVAVFLEVNERWGAALEALRDEWPHFQPVPQPGNFGLAVYSRLPLEHVRIEYIGNEKPVVIARIRVGKTPITLLAAHPAPPVSASVAAGRNRQLARLADLVAAIEGEKIVAGDLNTTSWSPVFSDFLGKTGLVDSRRGRGIQPSWRADLPVFLRIPIDHCLVSPGLWVVRREIGPDVGSDHLPVIVEVAPGS